MADINVADLQEQASAATGLHDFGDSYYLDGLTRLVASANAEAKLSEAGAPRFAGAMVGYLVNRLKVVDYAKSHPELLAAPVEKPMFVFGLPRTGTTLTINLLASDPMRRTYMRWESLNSVPPPSANWREDPRYLAEVEKMAMSLKYMPHISAIHHEDADSPSECQFAMAQSFVAEVFDSQWQIPSYRQWFLHEADYKPAFDYQKMQLQVLQAELGGRWTLKNPWHPLYLPAIREVYPDAQFVMTHRDPVAVVGSACSLLRAVRPLYSDDVVMAEIAEALLTTFDLMIERSEAYRAANGADSICDIDYKAQMADPIGTMRRVYAHFGEELTDEAAAAMQATLDANPQGKHGKHSYSLEEFGLNADQIKERYADYMAKYNLG